MDYCHLSRHTTRTEEEIRRIAGDYQKGLKDADKLSDKKCRALVYDFMTEMNYLLNAVRNDPFDLINWEWEDDEGRCQGMLDQAIDTCITIATQVDGFEHFFDKQSLDDIMSLRYVKAHNDEDDYDGYYLQITRKEK